MIVFKPKTDYPSLDLMLYTCGTGDCECKRSWGPGIKDHYGFYYITDGHGYLTIESQTFEVKTGDCFIIPPGTLSYYGPYKTNDWDYFWISFNGLAVKHYLNRLNVSAKTPLLPQIDSHKINHCFQMIFNSAQQQNSMDFQALSGFYLLLSTLAENVAPKNDLPLATKQESYIRQAIEFIETNYSRKITVEEISNYVGINRKYLTRIFNEKLNVTPQHYLIQFRMEKARALLMETTLSIQEIAFSVGYSDALIFSKTFKKFNGLAPKSFRLQ